MAEKKIIRNFPEYLREGTNLNDWADAWNLELEDLQSYLDAAKIEIQISTANGQYLNEYGSNFGLLRETGETDAQYRARILSYWSTITSSGTIGDLKKVISLSTGIDEDDIIITEIDAAKFLISFNIGVNFDLIETVKEIVYKSKAAGVYPFFEIRPGFIDEVTVTDNFLITDINKKIWGGFNWGDKTLF